MMAIKKVHKVQTPGEIISPPHYTKRTAEDLAVIEGFKDMPARDQDRVVALTNSIGERFAKEARDEAVTNAELLELQRIFTARRVFTKYLDTVKWPGKGASKQTIYRRIQDTKKLDREWHGPERIKRRIVAIATGRIPIKMLAAAPQWPADEEAQDEWADDFMAGRFQLEAKAITDERPVDVDELIKSAYNHIRLSYAKLHTAKQKQKYIEAVCGHALAIWGQPSLNVTSMAIPDRYLPNPVGAPKGPRHANG